MFLLLCLNAILLLDSTDTSKIQENSPPNYLAWNYAQMNPTCTGPGGGRNPCQDIRICNFAWASVMMGGQPTICGWVGKGVEKVCCGLPLVLGKNLMERVDAEKARNRECGSKTFSRNLSKTENLFFEILSVLPPVDVRNPKRFDPPLDLHVEPMISAISATFTRQGNFPWMVTIFCGSTFVCGGTLIDRIHILSAAHCILSSGKKPDPTEYSVRMGNIHVDGGVPFSVSKIQVHESYDPDLHYNDIAILTLEQEILVPSIPHICLPPIEFDAEIFQGKNTTWLGWENTELGTGTVLFLNIVDNMHVVPSFECAKTYERFLKEKLPQEIDSFLCAVSTKDSKETCQSDAGSILMFKNSSLPDYDPEVHWTLIGIAALAYDCNELGKTAIYTPVSQHKQWIIKHTAN